MKKNISKFKVSWVVSTIMLVILFVANILCFSFSDAITEKLCTKKVRVGAETVESKQLCENIVEEGIVLLKNAKIPNSGKSLPLKNKKVNVFGWSATDAGFVQVGVGSGSSPIYTSKDPSKDKSVKFLEALEMSGIEYNKDIIDEYKKFNSTNRETNRGTHEVYRLYEPTRSFYKPQLIKDAQEFSDTAIIVVSRISGENTTDDQDSSKGEIPTVQDRLYTEFGLMSMDTTRTYLDLTKYEEALIEMCDQYFNNVVLVVNSSNTMHLNVKNRQSVDSVISVGITGERGAVAIPKVLWGEVNPSGKLASTHIYEPTTEASFVNHTKKDFQIQYLEDIYIGYKWFETADSEGFWGTEFAQNMWGVNEYNDVVEYPFGYGLSYTKFNWQVKNLSIPNGSTLNKNSKIKFDVTVKNVGSVAGKDVVQIYLEAPYKNGGIEKSSSKLVAFFKTPTLPADGKTTYTETVEIDLYELASYDAYDKNNNGFSGYEIEQIEGMQYKIKVMTDAHNLKDCKNNVISYNVVGGGIKFETDPITNNKVENRFTGANAYAGVPIDGSTVGAETKYLTRSNFLNSFPISRAKTPNNEKEIQKGFNYINGSFNQTEMPITDVESNLRLFTKADGSYATKTELKGNSGLIANEELFKELSNYNSEMWEPFINQMSIKELKLLIENGGFKTEVIESIGKPQAQDRDGGAGLNEVIMGIGNGREEWTVFPSQSVLACTWNKELSYQLGECVAKEANQTAINGWYAPTVNLYRSAYNARNYEAFSEDPLLSGKLAAEVIIGAKNNGMYCYLKHFVLSELGVNPYMVKTWCTEQNLRENYMRPFEIAVKEGGANAIMSSFNCVGATWSGASYPCLTQILRNEWGFKGSVITDYNKMITVLKCKNGVRAGNDIWLNPRDTNDYPLSAKNPTDIYCAKIAAKHILYTYVSTYVHAKEYNPEFKFKFMPQSYPWWKPALVATDAVAVISCLLWVSIPLIKNKRKQKNRA